MLKTIGWLIWLFFYFFSILPRYYKAKRLKKEGRQEELDQLTYAESKKWVDKLFHNIKFNLTVEGRENLPQKGEVVVFVSNHQSYLDIPIFLRDLEASYALVAKKSLGKLPFLSGWMRVFDCIFLEREDVRSAAKMMQDAEAILKRGRSLVVCPEGTRSMSDEMGEFKAGAMRMALRTGVDIIPLAIDGSYKALEGNGYKVQPADVRLVILPRVHTQGLSKQEQRALPKKLEEMVRAAKDHRPQPA